MSVKFERETVKTATSVPQPKGPLAGTSGDHPIAAAIGTALTGGKDSAGLKGYLAVSRTQNHNIPADPRRPI